MPQDKIVVRGAREHNLKNVDVEIPRDRLVVITGLSGSGKSSLAFDTIFAEGQRRYVESLSAYARQFLGQMEKPDVDDIEGLSPAISIDQKSASRNPRSTVGTVTEIYDHLRLLYARIGHPHCPNCGREISRQTVQQIVDQVLQLAEGTRFMVLAPIVRARKGEYRQTFEDVRKAGYVRVRVDGALMEVGEALELRLDRYKQHTIEVVVDRLVVRPDVAGRLADSLDTALRLAEGVVVIAVVDGPEHLFSEHLSCAFCGISVEQLEPRSFSFNSPHGACPACTGLGTRLEVDPDLVLNPNLSIAEGGVLPFQRVASGGVFYGQVLEAVAQEWGFSLKAPIRDLAPEHRQVLLYGAGDRAVTLRYHNKAGRERQWDTTWEGVVPNLQRRYKETGSDWAREEIQRYMSERPCPECKGARLKPESLAVTVGGLSIDQLTARSVVDVAAFFRDLQLSEREQAIAYQVLKEINARLGFLVNVGLDYLTLNRSAATLAGGEAQRIRLATQIGSSLMGVLYILDEPSIGLHQRDNTRLIATLLKLRDLGNTVLVVEHDEETIRTADWVIDIGPGAGEHGGRVVAAGTVGDLVRVPESITGQYLSGARAIPVPSRRRPGSGCELVVRGARANNLKGIDVRIPLGKLVCVTGVSGSGKSTLINDILYRRLAQHFHGARERPGQHTEILGLEHLDKVIDIDQSPIGRTPRSNPATYTGAFTPIRELFAQVPEARLRGYAPGRFSFNVKGGRCEACRGEGILQIEMQFLPDVYVACEVCKGKRYNREALEIRYKGLTIAEVLEQTVEEALEFFQNIPAVKSKMATLDQVGLGYIHLGQPATTLSGGEAQRVKLATELSRRATGRTLYILDEPTTGLHFADIQRLLGVLEALTDAGNTVVVIEHNLDVIKTADWIIDLGPEGGEGGGRVIATGTPEEVALVERSFTGQYLRPILARAGALAPALSAPAPTPNGRAPRRAAPVA